VCTSAPTFLCNYQDILLTPPWQWVRFVSVAVLVLTIELLYRGWKPESPDYGISPCHCWLERTLVCHRLDFTEKNKIRGKEATECTIRILWKTVSFWSGLVYCILGIFCSNGFRKYILMDGSMLITSSRALCVCVCVCVCVYVCGAGVRTQGLSLASSHFTTWVTSPALEHCYLTCPV
jgi:hypothetical protein